MNTFSTTSFFINLDPSNEHDAANLDIAEAALRNGEQLFISVDEFDSAIANSDFADQIVVHIIPVNGTTVLAHTETGDVLRVAPTHLEPVQRLARRKTLTPVF